ncbi:Na(+)-translocating NADH-quinone reductase subunit F [Flavobacterium sp. CS20]|jgi:hypothetical protein|uniref:Na(+)-translocating NADH-quinone reductase subunit F n=1 Tax=Flavobacterium sp. CS20 TaxID=2775246 RepID=UPI001B3A3733|nr:Na(+)-translocating NADH-quinone reductase subunit F [Flavobacterium sp. CS20]QTY27003.1 Na(+)-translocating NADH-quinone reductase subunit F [Flavobacterium sp. CS20]
MAELSKQELHNLAMNIVGKDLEDQGYEFLAVNSKLKKNPQFVALKNKKLHFVVVRAISYPDNPRVYDDKLMTKMKNHADKFNALTFFAGVGLANRSDYERPLTKTDDYVVNYNGMIKIE